MNTGRRLQREGILDRVKVSIGSRTVERLRTRSLEAGISPSAMVRDLLEEAAVVHPDARKVLQLFLTGSTFDRFKAESERTGTPVATLVRATLEHALQGGER